MSPRWGYPPPNVIPCRVRAPVAWNLRGVPYDVFRTVGAGERTLPSWSHDEMRVMGCRKGVALRLAQAGFTDIRNLSDGMMEWNGANLPTTRK